MAAKLTYNLKIQGSDEDNIISTQAEVDASLDLPDDVASDQTYPIPAGVVDMPLYIIGEGTVDFVALIPKNQLTVKFNSALGTPFPLRQKGGMMVDGEAVASAIYVTNAGSATSLRVIQAVR